MKRGVLPLVILGILLSFTVPAQAQSDCEFRLGFKAIFEAIPDQVGTCIENEHYAENGDSQQGTTAWHGKGGLLVWRKADNWTAFTDGSTTWVNGPNGLQERPNSECFCFEAGCNCQGSSTAAPPPPSPPAAAVCEYSGDSKPVIKGNISADGEKIYHAPGQRYYNQTQIDTSKGERWFCTEADARAAGWRASKS